MLDLREWFCSPVALTTVQDRRLRYILLAYRPKKRELVMCKDIHDPVQEG